MANIKGKKNSKEKLSKDNSNSLKNELKKVTWPEKEQLLKSTFAIITVIVVIALIIFISDSIFTIANKKMTESVVNHRKKNQTTEVKKEDKNKQSTEVKKEADKKNNSENKSDNKEKK